MIPWGRHVHVFLSSRRRHTRWTGDWSSDVCSSDLGGDRLVDDGGAGKRSTAMHHPVTHRVNAGQPAEELPELPGVRAAVPGVHLELGGDLVTVAEHAQLEAAGSGVDHQNAGHGGLAAGCQHQSLTSGRSSPCSRVQAWCRARVSTICCRSHAALLPRPGTRSITSITRWNRSMSFITTMSNGVVVVPSSLYPRTWNWSCAARL